MRKYCSAVQGYLEDPPPALKVLSKYPSATANSALPAAHRGLANPCAKIYNAAEKSVNHGQRSSGGFLLLRLRRRSLRLGTAILQ